MNKTAESATVTPTTATMQITNVWFRLSTARQDREGEKSMMDNDKNNNNFTFVSVAHLHIKCGQRNIKEITQVINSLFMILKKNKLLYSYWYISPHTCIEQTQWKWKLLIPHEKPQTDIDLRDVLSHPPESFILNKTLSNHTAADGRSDKGEKPLQCVTLYRDLTTCDVRSICSFNVNFKSICTSEKNVKANHPVILQARHRCIWQLSNLKYTYLKWKPDHTKGKVWKLFQTDSKEHLDTREPGVNIQFVAWTPSVLFRKCLTDCCHHTTTMKLKI